MTHAYSQLGLRVGFGLMTLAGMASLGGCQEAQPGPTEVSVSRLTQAEIRGVWVATVANIDWPSAKGLTDQQRRGEMLRILDTAKGIGLNTIFFQVRPTGDAIYRSDLEPWSEFLTGTSGVGPADGSDPLEEWVREAHARGIELHAWINPYRVGHPKLTGPQSASHPSQALAAVTREYGEYKWMDPGEPVAKEHTLKVVEDICRRYEIDGVHVDDYFYPYPVNEKAGKKVEFPDDGAWSRYQASGGNLSRDDWRRANINSLIVELGTRAKASARGRNPARPLTFSISPFGIWRPGFPAGVKGFDAYAGLFADARKWTNEGTIDVVVPQLYWKIEAPEQPYVPLLNWWESQRSPKVRLAVGLNASRIGVEGPKGFLASEITRQIEIARGTKGASGYVLFSMKPLLEDRDGIAGKVRQLNLEVNQESR
ncbi:MAG: family 10 glycosylhydrolase [Planctomycetes bacterium]|nr:family 10 glycosylhydrolase [Planctomycetota bacterium]